jgi:TRAP-type C4-dicarboxylate transport system substrate-binding protein
MLRSSGAGPWVMAMMRLSAFAAAVAVALLAAPACAQVRWSLPSAYPADNFHSENLDAFAQEVAEGTAGKLAIKTYPNASVHDNEDPMFGIDVVPFLAASYDEARKLWAASKPAIERKFAAQGLMVLFAVPWPPQGIYAKKEINTVADMQGLSWRVYNAGTERIAQIVGAYPVTIQAADLQRALATGLINAFMTSVATGYDSKAWETMTYFYDTQAWLPKNVTLVNKAAFDRLDKPTQEVLLKAAASAEARGWSRSQERHHWYADQLAAHGLKVLPPSDALKSGLHQVGERLTAEWLVKAGSDGQAVIEAYRRSGS